jgi:hypothetical protein
MKKKILVLAGMAAMLAFSSDAFAINADATATIGSSLSVSVDTHAAGSGKLVFGYIIPDGTNDGSVTVGPTAAGNDASNVTLTTGITRSPAAFSLSGSDNSAYTVTLPEDNTISLAGPGPSMAVNGFTSSLTSNKGTLASGAGAFTVGATLSVKKNQVAGVYTSTFPVTVAYY